MRVELRTISNRNFSEECDPSMTVGELKDRMSAYDLNRSSMKFTYKGKVLDDRMTLGEAGVDGTGFIIITVARIAIKKTPQRSQPRPVELPPPPPVSEEPVAVPEPEKIAPSAVPLPAFVDPRAKYDPTTFERDIQQLELMGFPRAECEDALRTAVYDIELASVYLLEGIPCTNASIDLSMETFNEDEMTQEESIDQVKRVLDGVKRGVVEYSHFAEWIQAAYPSWAYGLLHNPIQFFTEFGFDPNDFLPKIRQQNRPERGMYEELISEFSDEEQEAIHRIERNGFDTMIAIQVYTACQKNEAETLECLRSMNL